MLSKRENALLAYEGEKTEYVPCFFSACQIIPSGSAMEMPERGKAGYDGYGVHQTPTESTGGEFTPSPDVPPVLDLDDITDWKSIVTFPDYTKVPHAEIAEKLKQDLHLNPKEYVQDFFFPNGIFERLHFLMGFENAMIAMMEEPEAVYDLVGAIADKKIEYIQYVEENYHPDYFTYLDDYAFMNGLMLDLDTFRSIFKPHLARIVEAAKKAGLKYKQHCCGKMEDLLDDFLDIGITRFDPVQPVNDLNAMRKRAGKNILLMGGLNVQNVIDRDGVTPEEIEAEVKRCCETYGQDGGYIIYGASLHMYNPASYQPGGPLYFVNQAAEKYGKIK
jgi:hypothetical protein